MKYNILYILKKNNSGQTFIEFIITFIVLFLCTFAVVEIARLIAFKNCLQAATSYMTHKVAYSEIFLGKSMNESLRDKISNEIENYMNSISTTMISFDNSESNGGVLYVKKHDVRVYLKLVNNSSELPSGVYIESQTCLPVLFTSFFKHFRQKPEVGNSIQDNTKTCLGHFNSSPKIPLSWFRVRVAAYSPWPASTQIFNHGLALPKTFNGLEEENRNDVLTALEGIK